MNSLIPEHDLKNVLRGMERYIAYKLCLGYLQRLEF